MNVLRRNFCFSYTALICQPSQRADSNYLEKKKDKKTSRVKRWRSRGTVKRANRRTADGGKGDSGREVNRSRGRSAVKLYVKLCDVSCELNRRKRHWFYCLFPVLYTSSYPLLHLRNPSVLYLHSEPRHVFRCHPRQSLLPSPTATNTDTSFDMRRLCVKIDFIGKKKEYTRLRQRFVRFENVRRAAKIYSYTSNNGIYLQQYR